MEITRYWGGVGSSVDMSVSGVSDVILSQLHNAQLSR